MARKKVSHHQEKQGENTLKPHNKDDPKPTMAMNNNMNNEASMEKLESLKSLNTMLLKEAVERRKQVESLMQAKGCLESELTLSNSEKEGLVSELTQSSESALRLEMERNVVFGFVALQVGKHGEAVEKERDGFRREKMKIEKEMESLEREMRQVLREKSEIAKAKSEKDCEVNVLNEKVNGLMNEIGKERDVSKRVNRERDEIRVKLDDQIECSKGLRVKLMETEEREKGNERKVEELVVKYKGVVEEKQERERRIKAMTREKDSIEKSLVEANKVIEEMKRKIEGIVKEKEGIEEERNVEKEKRSELESVVNGLNETVLSLQEEEVRLRSSVAELKNKCVEGLETRKEMAWEIDEHVGEKNERERRLESLVEEKSLVENDLREALKRICEQKHEIEQLVNEKIELAEGIDRKESVIVELQKNEQEFRDDIRELENSCKGQTEKIKNLESEFGYFKDALEQVTAERDEARKGFDDEKQNVFALKVKSEEMEKNVEKNIKLVEVLKAENVNIIAEKEALESRCEMLKKEVASTENALAEVQKEFDALKSNVESANVNSGRILSMLRSTAELVCSKDEKNASDGFENQINREGTEPYIAELELIKNAFKSKESKAEDMKRQLVLLQNSVVEAHKKKSFWTLVSSATTLFAALSLAYIARGH